MRRFLTVMLSFLVGVFSGAYLTTWLMNASNTANRIDTLRISNSVNYEQMIQIITEENDNYITLGPKEKMNIQFSLNSDMEIYWVSTDYSETEEKEKILIIDVDIMEKTTHYKAEKKKISIEFNKK